MVAFRFCLEQTFSTSSQILIMFIAISCVARSLLDDIKTKQRQSYGHVQRMGETRLPKDVMKWSPLGRRKPGRPKLTWAEGIRGLMGENGLMEEEWNDRGNWRKKII